MSGGGGKGGSQSSKVEIPPWAEQAMIKSLGRAEKMAEIGYQPYYGPDVAAFSPMQEQAMQTTANAAAAYGLAPAGMDAMAGVPQAQEFAGGIRGYSSGDLFEQARAEFEARNPVQAQQYNALFAPTGVPEAGAAPTDLSAVDPNTGLPYYNSINPATGQPYYMEAFNLGRLPF